MKAATIIDIPELRLYAKGKVRNVYDLGETLLVVASDRISAFDYVLPSGIPDKGRILTSVSAYWFRRLEHLCRHHMISDRVDDFPEAVQPFRGVIDGRSMLVWKARRIDVECVVRGYLAGSAWKEYAATGGVAGQALPKGLRSGGRIEPPVFTPSTKCDDGHDRNITVQEMLDTVGPSTGQTLMRKSLALYRYASAVAERKGITIVDTKFEFGYHADEIILIDEALTPDSSRYWLEVAGGQPISLDKQFVRDFLETTGWDKNSPPPELPSDIVEEARRRYLLLHEKLTGERPRWAR